MDELPRLMLVTDRHRTRGRDLVALVAKAAEGGLRMVQVREKGLTTDRLRELIQRIRGVVPAEVRLLVNSSTRAARTMGVGLHLPAAAAFPASDEDGKREDYPLLGRSVHNAAEAREALRDRPSYLVLGTIFPTESKPGHPGSGVELVRRVVERVRPIPVYAIGGVTVSGIPRLIRAGAHGVAVCGAILGANDPRRVAEAMTLSLQVACRAVRNGPGGAG
jgi:thiamine-phosphate pyrophosphorylase